MKTFLRFLFAFLIIAGGVSFWKLSGTDNAVTAQKEVVTSGYYYNGETWMNPNSYDELKQSLALRDPSLQTSSDLDVLPETRDGRLLIKYSFFTTQDFEGLNRTRDFPSWFNQGAAFSTGVIPILFFATLLIWAISILPLGDKQNG